MDKGIFIFFGYKMPVRKRLELIKNAGFNTVMIWWGNGEGEYEGNKYDYASLAQEYNLNICNAHLPFENANNLWIDGSKGDDYSDFICKQIAECGEYNINTVVLHLSRGSNPPYFNNIGLERLKKIVDVSEKYNVNLALENLRNIDYLDFIFNDIQSEKLGVCFDSGHNNFFTPNRDVLNEYKDKIFTLHLDDNFGDDDIHMIPYDGNVDWDRVTNHLADMNYKGVLSLEVSQGGHEKYCGLSPQQFLELAYESTVKIEKDIEAKRGKRNA